MDKISDVALGLLKTASKLDENRLPRCADKITHFAENLLSQDYFSNSIHDINNSDPSNPAIFEGLGKIDNRKYDALQGNVNSPDFMQHARQMADALFRIRPIVEASAVDCVMRDTTGSPEQMAKTCMSHLMQQAASEIQVVGRDLALLIDRKLIGVFQNCLREKARIGHNPQALKELAEMTGFNAVDTLDAAAAELLTPAGQYPAN